ncbi:MAG: hypothetical protein ACR2PG_06305 [Hyphomicrobiaceae bacterium]
MKHYDGRLSPKTPPTAHVSAGAQKALMDEIARSLEALLREQQMALIELRQIKAAVKSKPQ